MSASYTLRRARPTLDDAEALLRVEQASLADSPYTPMDVLGVLARPEHFAYLAIRERSAAGFLSCLETPTPQGARLEVDMLGVLPEHRGRRLATRLIMLALREADGRGLRLARGVAREGNLPSQRAFAGAGLRAGPQPHELLVYPISGTSPLPPRTGYGYAIVTSGEVGIPHEVLPPFRAAGLGCVIVQATGSHGDTVALAACLRVHTLAYAGIWIERLWTSSGPALRAALRAVVEEAKRLGLDEVGHLATPQAPALVDAHLDWLREGFVSMGRYLVYQRVAPLVQSEACERT